MSRQKVNIIVGRHQMPAGRATKGIKGEWAEQFLLLIAKPTKKIFGFKRHTGLNSYRYMWI